MVSVLISTPARISSDREFSTYKFHEIIPFSKILKRTGKKFMNFPLIEYIRTNN